MIDIEKMAAAIEADLGESIPGLRESIAQLENGGGRVVTAEQLEVRQARSALGLSQLDFSRAIDTPVSTLRDWEQGRTKPPGAALCLMRLLTSHPQLLAA